MRQCDSASWGVREAVPCNNARKTSATPATKSQNHVGFAHPYNAKIMFFFGTCVRGVKIQPPEKLRGDLDAEFHGDSEFHGREAIGGQERGDIGGQRWNMEDMDQRRMTILDPSEQRSKYHVQKW